MPVYVIQNGNRMKIWMEKIQEMLNKDLEKLKNKEA